MDWRAKTLIPGLSTTIKIYYLGQAISLFEHYSARFDWEDGASRWRATRREQKLDYTRDGADTHARMHSAADRYLVSLSNVRHDFSSFDRPHEFVSSFRVDSKTLCSKWIRIIQLISTNEMLFKRFVFIKFFTTSRTTIDFI